MPKLTQENRFIQVDTPLGKDALVLLSYKGREEMSRPFSYKLEMVSEQKAFDPTKIVGEQVSFKIEMPDDTWRFFNGHVWRFAGAAQQGWEEGYRHYWAEVVPWLKFLSLNKACRIFQEKKVPEIVEQIFKDRGFTDYQQKLRGNYPKLEFCLQWQESDYDFIARLLEYSGIFYYFAHDDKKHTLVLADHKGACEKADQYSVKHFSDFDSQLQGQVRSWEHRYTMVAGKSKHTDYNFETPKTKLDTSEQSIVGLKGIEKYVVFEYPAGYGDKNVGSGLAGVRIEALELGYDNVTGSSNCPSFSPGRVFKLVEHPVDAEKNKEYTLTAVEQTAREPSLAAELRMVPEGEAVEEYSNTFRCIPSQAVFRPARKTPRPTVQGPQSATVVGPRDSEIFTDEYGRVKVMFPWDADATGDEKKCSCWMRVSQESAGMGWGGISLPRVGQEVLVEFLNGDPDRPIVTGRVYNAVQEVPYKLPDFETISGVKTRTTSKGSRDTYNELRFKDYKNEEHIYFHAERDFVRVVENADAVEVGYSKSRHDKKDYQLKITDREGAETAKGDQVVDIFNDRKVTIEKGIDSVHVMEKDQVIKIDKGDQLVTIAKGHQKVAIKANQEVAIKGDQSVVVTGPSTTESKQKILLKVGQNSITIDQQGVKITGMKVIVDGTMVEVNGKATTKIKAPMTDIKGDAMLKLKGGIVMIN